MHFQASFSRICGHFDQILFSKSDSVQKTVHLNNVFLTSDTTICVNDTLFDMHPNAHTTRNFGEGQGM